jgi:hypothetical protein
MGVSPGNVDQQIPNLLASGTKSGDATQARLERENREEARAFARLPSAGPDDLTDERASHIQMLCGEVNILPLQGEKFAAP